MELASAQASQGADECSMRHGSVEDQIDSTDSMDSFASAARTESRSSSPGTGVDISRLSPLPSPGALPGSSQSSSLESGDPYPFPRARPEGWKKESSFDEGNARHQAVLRILCQLVVDQGASVKTTTKLDSNCKPGAIKGRARHGDTPPVSFWSLRGVGAALTAAPPGAVAGADEEQQEAAANLGQFAAAQLHLKTNPSGDTRGSLFVHSVLMLPSFPRRPVEKTMLRPGANAASESPSRKRLAAVAGLFARRPKQSPKRASQKFKRIAQGQGEPTSRSPRADFKGCDQVGRRKT
jgi:hypothetical protein